MMSRASLLSIAAAFLALAACKNPKYCDADTPCDDPARPFCDLTGTVSGIENNCTQTPGGNPDANTRCDSPSDCSGATPVCKLSTGICVECLDVSTCATAEEPVCNATSNLCSGCTGDADCTGRTDGRTSCDTATGICQVCVADEDCATATAPICDATLKTCRGCGADAECTASGVCNLHEGTKGNCVPEADVIYVAKGGAGTTCTKASKCDTFDEAFMAIGNPTASRKWILVDASVLPFAENRTLNNTAAVIKGSGATLSGVTAAQPALRITGTSDVRIEGLTIGAPTGLAASTDQDGVRCEDGSASPKVTLVGVTLAGSKGDGLDGTRCIATITGSTINANVGTGVTAFTNSTVTVSGSTLSANTGGGVVASGGTVSLVGSSITGNAGGGLSLNASNFTIVNNFFWDNGAAGTLFGAIDIVHVGSPNPKRLEFNTIAQNEAADTHPAGVQCQVTTTSVAAKHNIVFDNDRDAAMSQVGPIAGPNGCTWTFSIVTDTAFLGTGNINSPNPTFVGLGTGNLHLAPTSSGINVGDPAATDIATDIDGQARANGTPDMGADEVHP